MKKISLKLSVILLICFVVIVSIQYWHQDSLFKHWLNKDFKENGRRIFNNILQHENNFWIEKKRTARQTALIFTKLLARPADSSANDSLPLRQSRFQIGLGETAMGIYTPNLADFPAQAETIAAGLPLIQYYLTSLKPSVFSTYFISKDNWLAVSPPLRALEIAENFDFSKDTVYILGIPETNPEKEAKISGLHYDDIWKKWMISLAMPVYSAGRFQGIIGHDIPIEQLLELVQTDKYCSNSSLFITDDSLQVILHPELIPLYKKNDFNRGQKFDFNSMIRDKKTRQILAGLKAGPFSEKLFRFGNEQEMVFVYRQKSTGWHYVFTLSSAKLFANIRKGGIIFFTLNALVLLVFMVLLFFFLKASMLKPLTQINDSLLFFLQTGNSRGARQRSQLFKEIGEVFTNIENVFSQLQKKISETKEAREYLEKMMQTTQSIVITLDARMRPTSMNECGLKKLQIGHQEIASLRIGDFLGKKFIRTIAAELKESGQAIDQETTLTLKTGEKIDIALSLSQIRDFNNRISGYLAMIADISQRKKAEMNLKNQILFSRQIFQSIPEMIIIVDRRQRITFINTRARDLIKATGVNIIGQNLNFILTRNSIESGFDELVRNVLEGGNSFHRINTGNPILEEENYVDLIIEPLKSGAIIIGGIILLRDISEWRSLTAQLRLLQGFMQKLINASPYAVISINNHGLITTWNQSAEKILGITFANAFGKNLYALLPLFDKYKDIINEIMILKKTIYLNDEKVFIGEEDFKIANFTLYPVTAEQSGVVIHIEDVSALKKLESSLLQAQKMESLGLLTSHIIHDFNNLLSGIMGYASLLEKKIADNPKVKKYVSTIINSSERASTLINQLLNFSRKKMAEKEIININDLIKESLDFLAMNLKVINLDIQLYQSQILLRADKTKISQVLINLIINARDALENVPQPILRIKTDLVDISNQSNLLDGQYALIEISDNGSGISQENLNKIFEPFFTTKGQGRGTGLGLAIVREIIRDYNGQIEVDSKTGRGTLFKILLPVIAKEMFQSIAHEETEPSAPLEGMVLLIDDEEVVREIGHDMLKTLGLKCLTAANGTEGIEIFKKNSAEITLVILDIEMPGISGEKVFHILKELRPEIKILIASGYGKEYLETEIFKSKISHFIPKPFKIEQLSYQVNKLIGNHDV
ncbi:MAG: PAS domain S-box protein [Acidobacteria bacterium]|nr:PAS domain S-box protein [Acidobacteriota bacterium]